MSIRPHVRAVAQDEIRDDHPDFLATVSFDDLWSRAGAEVRGRGWDEAQAREEFLDHHRGLQAFYGRVAAAGHAVVEAVWA